jgi:hypothetical protein
VLVRPLNRSSAIFFLAVSFGLTTTSVLPGLAAIGLEAQGVMEGLLVSARLGAPYFGEGEAWDGGATVELSE